MQKKLNKSTKNKKTHKDNNKRSTKTQIKDQIDRPIPHNENYLFVKL